MLKICTKFSELDFDELCRVYGYDADDHNEREELFMYLNDDFFRVKNSFYAIWVVNGKYVSAARMEPYCDGYLLEAVETEKAERRKGYARCLLDAVLSCGRIQIAYAHIYKNNRASLELHRSCGFQPHQDYAAFIDGTVSANACTLKWIN